MPTSSIILRRVDLQNLANIFDLHCQFLPWPHSLQESHRTSTRNQEGIAHESYRWQIVSERSSDDRDLDEARELRNVRFDLMTQTLCVLFVCAWLLGTLAHLTMQARISNMILIWYHIISTDAYGMPAWFAVPHFKKTCHALLHDDIRHTHSLQSACLGASP